MTFIGNTNTYFTFKLNLQFCQEKILSSHQRKVGAAKTLRLKFPLFCFPKPRIFQGQDAGFWSEYGIRPKRMSSKSTILIHCCVSRIQMTVLMPVSISIRIFIAIIISHIIFMHIPHQQKWIQISVEEIKSPKSKVRRQQVRIRLEPIQYSKDPN